MRQGEAATPRSRRETESDKGVKSHGVGAKPVDLPMGRLKEG